jgi:hypothetical protein
MTYYTNGINTYRNANNLASYHTINYSKIINQKFFSQKYTMPTRPYIHSRITNDNFSIINEGNSFTFNTSLAIGADKRHLESDATLSLYLKLNDNSIQDVSFSNINPEINTDKIFLVVSDTTHLNTMNSNHTQFGLVSFDVNNNNLINPNVEIAGSFMSGLSGTFAHDFNNIQQTQKINTYGGDISILYWLAPISSIQYLYTGGIKLNTTINIRRRNSTIDNLFNDPSDQASLSLDLALHNDTINISGGSNYMIGDSFTVVSDGSNGQITVTDIGDQGDILGTYLTETGNGFINEPSVVYNNSSGSNANITIKDIYDISQIRIDNPGNGYYSGDIVELIDPTFPIAIDSSRALLTIVPQEIGVVPKLNNLFSIDKIDAKYSPDYYEYTPNLFIIDIANNQIISNSYIDFTI